MRFGSFWFQLMDQAGDGSGGGDGSGSGDGGKPGITQADVDKAVNGVATRLEKKFGTDIANLSTNLDKVTSLLEMISKPPAGGDGGGGGDAKGGDGKGGDKGDSVAELNAKIQNLTNSVKSLTQRADTAESAAKKAQDEKKETDKKLAIKSALTGYFWRKPGYAEVAFREIASNVSQDDDGSFIADGLPLSDYVKKRMDDDLDGLLAPEDKGGAGAKGGEPRNKGGFDMDKIKPGMSLEEIEKASKEIAKHWV